MQTRGSRLAKHKVSRLSRDPEAPGSKAESTRAGKEEGLRRGVTAGREALPKEPSAGFFTSDLPVGDSSIQGKELRERGHTTGTKLWVTTT